MYLYNMYSIYLLDIKGIFTCGWPLTLSVSLLLILSAYGCWIKNRELYCQCIYMIFKDFKDSFFFFLYSDISVAGLFEPKMVGSVLYRWLSFTLFHMFRLCTTLHVFQLFMPFITKDDSQGNLKECKSLMTSAQPAGPCFPVS